MGAEELKSVPKPLRLLRPVPIYIIGVGSLRDGELNIATVSWVTPVSKVPPRVAVVIDKSNYTYIMIKKYKKFTLSIVDSSLLELAKYVGTRSRREVDKVGVTGVRLAAAGDGETPYVADAPGYILVNIEKEVDLNYSYMFIGKIIEARAREDAVTDRWLLENVNLALHLAKHSFVICRGEIVNVVNTRWGVAVKKPWRGKISGHGTSSESEE